MPSDFLRFLQIMAKDPPRIILPTGLSKELARPEAFVFGFKFLKLDHEEFGLPFDGSRNEKINGFYSLVRVLETLIDYSRTLVETASFEKERFHHIPEDKLEARGIAELKSVASGEIYQLGLNGNRERVVGFFRDAASPTFEVCILDTKHVIFPRDELEGE